VLMQMGRGMRVRDLMLNIVDPQGREQTVPIPLR
jgi:hypothetical protein